MPVAAVLLGVLLLVVLVEGEAGAADGDGGGDAFLDLVRVRVLGVLLGLVLLVHGVRSRCDGAELGELLPVLVVLLLLAPVGDLGRLRLGLAGGGLVVLAQEVVRHLNSVVVSQLRVLAAACGFDQLAVVIRDDSKQASYALIVEIYGWVMDLMMWCTSAHVYIG